VAAFVLQRFGHLLAEPRYLAAAERTLRAAWTELTRYPQSHATLLTALEELLHPPEIVIIRGEAGPIGEWQRELARLYSPRTLVLAVPNDAQQLPSAFADKPGGGNALAYVCRGSVCSAPARSVSALISELRAGEAR
jgi:hypothetical protein